MTKSLLHSQLEYQCPWFSIAKERVQFPDGRQGDYYVFKRDYPFVVIVPFIDKDTLLLLRQWRPTIKRWHWEFPAGAVDPGESHEQAGRRELREETSFESDRWSELGMIYVAVGHTGNQGYGLLAERSKPCQSTVELGEGEVIEVHHKTITEFETMIQDGTIQDAPTLAVWTMYKSKIQNLLG